MTLRTVFHLPLHQTEGFVGSLIRLMGLDLETPDHTTFRAGAPRWMSPGLPGAIHLAIDSTGLKSMGDGECRAHKHRTSNKRRAWRKLHIGVDAGGFIIASELTDSGVDDASVGVAMIEGIEEAIERFTADGACDTRATYEVLGAAAAAVPTLVIPPR